MLTNSGCGGPLLTTTVTVAPDARGVPADGCWSMITPSGTLSLGCGSTTNCQLASTNGRAVSSAALISSGTNGMNAVDVGAGGLVSAGLGCCVAVADVGAVRLD